MSSIIISFKAIFFSTCNKPACSPASEPPVNSCLFPAWAQQPQCDILGVLSTALQAPCQPQAVSWPSSEWQSVPQLRRYLSFGHTSCAFPDHSWSWPGSSVSRVCVVLRLERKSAASAWKCSCVILCLTIPAQSAWPLGKGTAEALTRKPTHSDIILVKMNLLHLSSTWSQQTKDVSTSPPPMAWVTPVGFCLSFSPSAKMVLVMLAYVHATVCEPQLRHCQDDIYAKKQGEKMHFGRNMERNNIEQVNKSW